MGFLLDQSNSIVTGENKTNNFKKMLQFVKSAAVEYGISRNGVRAGVLVYSDRASVRTKVQVHFKTCGDTQCFIDKTDAIEREGIHTFLNVALKTAKKDLFNTKNGHRLHVPSIAILLTDGGQTDIEKWGADAVKAAKALKEANITIIAFGISIRNVSTHQFLTSLADKYYIVSDFPELPKYLNKLKKIVCKSK